MGKLAAVAGIAFLGVVAVGYWYFQVPPKRDRKELVERTVAETFDGQGTLVSRIVVVKQTY